MHAGATAARSAVPCKPPEYLRRDSNEFALNTLRSIVLLVKIQCIVGASLNKRVANKCMREEIHAHNNGELYRIYKIHTKLTHVS